MVGELPGYAEFNRHVKLFLLDVARHHKLPDVDIVLSTSDSCHPPGAFNGTAAKCPDVVSTTTTNRQLLSPHFDKQLGLKQCKMQGPLLVYGKGKGDDHCVTYPDHTFAGWPVVNLPSWQDLW